jgi:hypothetical protein
MSYYALLLALASGLAGGAALALPRRPWMRLAKPLLLAIWVLLLVSLMAHLLSSAN